MKRMPFFALALIVCGSLYWLTSPSKDSAPQMSFDQSLPKRLAQRAKDPHRQGHEVITSEETEDIEGDDTVPAPKNITGSFPTETSDSGTTATKSQGKRSQDRGQALSLLTGSTPKTIKQKNKPEDTLDTRLPPPESPNIVPTIREGTQRPIFARGSGTSNQGAPTREDFVLPSTATPTATATAVPELPFVTGQSRGYSMLYAMQPEARATVEAELATLLDARLKEVHIGVLVDGTFGWDPDYLASIITRVTEDERTLTLALYLSNGPTQRVLEDSPITTNFPKSTPEDFRELIQFDPRTREEFRDLARRVIPLFALNARISPNNRNVVVPMLEDNLDSDSYQAIQGLTNEILGSIATTVRNPCPGCWEGNDTARFGNQLELHGRDTLPLLQRGDAFSLDGTGYALESEGNARGEFLVPELESLFQTLLNAGLSYIGLWRVDRQGLSDGPLQVPSLRQYSVPTAEHEETEKNLLRFGLPLAPEE